MFKMTAIAGVRSLLILSLEIGLLCNVFYETSSQGNLCQLVGNICFNGGTCIENVGNTLSCKCLEGYSGLRCEVADQPLQQSTPVTTRSEDSTVSVSPEKMSTYSPISGDRVYTTTLALTASDQPSHQSTPNVVQSEVPTVFASTVRMTTHSLTPGETVNTTTQTLTGVQCYECSGGQECSQPVDSLSVSTCAEDEMCAFINMTLTLAMTNEERKEVSRSCMSAEGELDGCLTGDEYLGHLAMSIPDIRNLISSAEGFACFCDENLCNTALIPIASDQPSLQSTVLVSTESMTTDSPTSSGIAYTTTLVLTVSDQSSQQSTPGVVQPEVPTVPLSTEKMTTHSPTSSSTVYASTLAALTDKPCTDNPCNNGGVCFPQPSNDFFCLCVVGFTGKTCLEEITSPTSTINPTFKTTIFPTSSTNVVITDPTEKPSTRTPTEGITEVAKQPDVLEEELVVITMTLAVANATEEEVEAAAEKVTQISRKDTFLSEDPTRVELVISSLESIVDTGYTNENVTEPVVEIIDNLMDVDENVINQGTSEGGRVVAALEELITNVQNNEGNVTIVRENLGVVAVKIEKKNIGESLVFAVVKPGDAEQDEEVQKLNTMLYADGDMASLEASTAAISVPREIIDLLDEDKGNSTTVPISFVIYKNSLLFTPSMPSKNYSQEERADISEMIVSQVISARIESTDVSTNLSSGSLIVSKFLLNVGFEFNKSTTKHCVLWDYDDDTQEGFWSEKGCMTSDEANHTVCSCDRFASFAILVRVDNGDIVLYYVTFIGSIISGICLILCIITFLSLRSLRSKQPTHIHINLCVSLLGFYVSFMLSIPAARNATLCKVASAAIHFFGLATVAWMTAEAVNMYFLFVKMERRGIKYFIPIASVLAYGSSAVCVALTAFLDKKSQFERASYCFIQPGNALYFGFLMPVAALFMVNFFIFVWVIRKMLCRPLLVSKTTKNARRNEIITRVRHGILFWFVLGLSWCFGFLSAITVDSKTVVFDYLYCIFTSLQGLMMFLLLCVANPEIKKAFRLGSQKVDVSTRTESSNVTKSTIRKKSNSQRKTNNNLHAGDSLKMKELPDIGASQA